MIRNYTCKPFLSRPEHSFYKGEDHLLITFDIHCYSKAARKGVSHLIPTMKNTILDIGLVIEGRSDSELPEQMLGVTRINNFDPECAVPFPEL